MVIVYTKPNCPQCNATKRWLQRRDVDYDEVAITEDLIEEFREQKLMTAPIVEANGVRWAGFQPDALEANTSK